MICTPCGQNYTISIKLNSCVQLTLDSSYYQTPKGKHPCTHYHKEPNLYIIKYAQSISKVLIIDSGDIDYKWINWNNAWKRNYKDYMHTIFIIFIHIQLKSNWGTAQLSYTGKMCHISGAYGLLNPVHLLITHPLDIGITN